MDTLGSRNRSPAGKRSQISALRLLALPHSHDFSEGPPPHQVVNQAETMGGFVLRKSREIGQNPPIRRSLISFPEMTGGYLFNLGVVYSNLCEQNDPRDCRWPMAQGELNNFLGAFVQCDTNTKINITHLPSQKWFSFHRQMRKLRFPMVLCLTSLLLSLITQAWCAVDPRFWWIWRPGYFGPMVWRKVGQAWKGGHSD